MEDSSDVLGKATVTRHMIEAIRQEAQTITQDSDRSKFLLLTIVFTADSASVEQKVIDLLRERSDLYSGDLSEARDRISMLESEQSRERDTLNKASRDINLAGTWAEATPTTMLTYPILRVIYTDLCG